MTIQELQQKMLKLNYPTNHMFDIETITATGVLINRMDLLRINALEIFEGGNSFLDIGCNKGFMSFILSGVYKQVVGYEPAKEICDFAEEIRKYYNLKNIKFINKGFDEIPENKTYDIVYVGNVHHYLFRNDIINNKKPFTFLNKLKKITNKVLILDGSFEVGDFATNALANENNWSDEIRDIYTINNFEKKLLPEFKLKRFRFNGIGEGISQRYTAVFK